MVILFYLVITLIFPKIFLDDKLNDYKYLNSDSDRRANTKLKISKTEIIFDLKFLNKYLSNSYGGYPRYPKSKWDWIFKNIQLDIQSLSNNTVDIYKVVKIMISYLKVIEDGHLEIMVKDNGIKIPFKIASKKISFLIDKNCPGNLDSQIKVKYYNIATEKIENRMVQFFSNDGTLEEKNKISKNNCYLPISASYSKEVSFSAKSKNWKYIKIGSNYTNQYFRQVKNFHKKISSTDNLIFDLRGNSGGSSIESFRFLAKIGISFKYPFRDSYRFDNIIAQQYYINLINESIFKGFKVKVMKKNLNFAINRLKHMPLNSNIFIRKQAPIFKTNPNQFKGKILVIADNICASSCEGLLAALQQYPGTLYVGSNTNGTSIVGNLGNAILPNSKIRVRFGNIFHSKFKTSEAYKENRGFLPDIWTDTATLNETKSVKIANKLVELGLL